MLFCKGIAGHLLALGMVMHGAVLATALAVMVAQPGASSSSCCFCAPHSPPKAVSKATSP